MGVTWGSTACPRIHYVDQAFLRFRDWLDSSSWVLILKRHSTIPDRNVALFLFCFVCLFFQRAKIHNSGEDTAHSQEQEVGCYIYIYTGSRGSKQERGQGSYPSKPTLPDVLPSVKLHLLRAHNCLRQTTYWWPCVQTHEPMGGNSHSNNCSFYFMFPQHIACHVNSCFSGSLKILDLWNITVWVTLLTHCPNILDRKRVNNCAKRGETITSTGNTVYKIMNSKSRAYLLSDPA